VVHVQTHDVSMLPTCGQGLLGLLIEAHAQTHDVPMLPTSGKSLLGL
jgi:hypothetical protein